MVPSTGGASNSPYTISIRPTGVYNDGWQYLGTLDTDVGIRYVGIRYEPEQPTEEELREHRERIRRNARELEEADEEADARAEALLLSFLSEEQQRNYRDGQWFEVVGSAGGRYRIRQGMVGNIDWLDEDGAAAGSLCCHPVYSLPHPDIMLAQMLALITDEKAFVRLAHRYYGYADVQ